jgi:hypothetical protein
MVALRGNLHDRTVRRAGAGEQGHEHRVRPDSAGAGSYPGTAWRRIAPLCNRLHLGRTHDYLAIRWSKSAIPGRGLELVDIGLISQSFLLGAVNLPPEEGRCLEGHLLPPVAGNSRVKILLAHQLVTRYAVTRYIKSLFVWCRQLNE